jgi:DNA-binding NtrC family response regulator
MSLLQKHTWPGNVRELQNIIERGIILSRGEITTAGLPPELQVQHQNVEACDGILKHREKESIMNTLRKFKGNRRQTADTLGISLRTLQYRLKELGLLVREES